MANKFRGYFFCRTLYTALYWVPKEQVFTGVLPVPNQQCQSTEDYKQLRCINVQMQTAHTFAFWFELVNERLYVFFAAKPHSTPTTLWPITHSLQCHSIWLQRLNMTEITSSFNKLALYSFSNANKAGNRCVHQRCSCGDRARQKN